MFHRYSSRFFSTLGVRLGLGLGLLLGSTGLVLATTLLLFMATYDGTAVRVAWAVTTETDVTDFDIGRKLPADTAFTPLASIVPTGQRSYTFADSCLQPGPSGMLQGPVVYRLTLRGPGPRQTYTTTVAGTVGMVQRSWGTIKAMFR